jgi:hypothetical protein
VRGRAGAQERWPRALLIVLVLVASLVLAAPAGAQEQPFDDTALIDEYREDVPTATGPVSTSGGSGGTTGSGGGNAAPPPLPSDVSQGLVRAVGQEDANRLEEVATSPRFGAPSHEPDEGALPASGDSPSPVSAAVNALADESGGSLLPLVLVLILATSAFFAAAVFFRHRERGVSA